jgi:predicted nucleotidyltransferase
MELDFYERKSTSNKRKHGIAPACLAVETRIEKVVFEARKERLLRWQRSGGIRVIAHEPAPCVLRWVAMDVLADLVAKLRRTDDRGTIPGVVAVYAFGSVAEARDHAESDVDVGIVLDRGVYPTARERFAAGLHFVAEIGSAAGRTLDVVVLNDAPPTLGRHVITVGRRLFCSDAEAAHAFERDMQLRAADLDPFLRRMRHIKLQALAR